MRRIPTFITVTALRLPLIKLGIVVLSILIVVSLADSLQAIQDRLQVMQTTAQLMAGDMMVKPDYTRLSDTASLQTDQAVTLLEKELQTPASYFVQNTNLFFSPDELSLTESGQFFELEGLTYQVPVAVEMDATAIARSGLAVTDEVMGQFQQAAVEPASTAPLLLGAAYRQQFSIGDELVFYDIENVVVEHDQVKGETIPRPFKVAGFLPENSQVTNFRDPSGEGIPLDRSMILPLMAQRQRAASPTTSDLGNYFFFLDSATAKQLTPFDLVRKMKDQLAGMGYIGVTLSNITENVDFSLKSYQGRQRILTQRMLVFSLLVFLQYLVLFRLAADKDQGTSQLFYLLGSTKGELFVMSQLFYLLLSLFSVTAAYLLNTFWLHKDWSWWAFGLSGLVVTFVLLVSASLSQYYLLKKVGVTS